jgi:hypothetical protein
MCGGHGTLDRAQPRSALVVAVGGVRQLLVKCRVSGSHAEEDRAGRWDGVYGRYGVRILTMLEDDGIMGITESTDRRIRSTTY